MGQEVSTISKDSSSLTPQDDATKQEVTVTTATTADSTNDASNGTSNATTNNKKTNKELTVKTQISSANNEYSFDQVFKTKDGTQSPDDSSLSSEESTILSPSASHSTATPLKSFQTIFTLPNCELMERLESTTLTKESILQAHNIIAQYNLSDETWYHNVNDSKEDSQTAIAIYLLQNSNLKNLRFKLVPSKLKEDAFWYSIFFLCMTSQEQYQLVHTSDGECSEKSSKELYKLVKCQSQDIVKLQQKIQELQLELKEALEHPQRVVTQPMVENVPEKERKTHTGTWIMEKESIEFLQLDEEIKKKLRDGKQKRLQDVHEQMKFILDSDDVKDSRGKWDGCGCDSYGGECGAEC